MTTEMWVAVVAVGVISSLLTVGVLLAAFRLAVKPKLDRRLESLARDIEERVRSGVEGGAEEMLPRFGEETSSGFKAAAEEVLPRFKEEVKSGFSEAAAEAMPRFREEVRHGFREGLSEAVSEGLLGKRGGELARRGSSVIEAGINLLFGDEDEEEGGDRG